MGRKRGKATFTPFFPGGNSVARFATGREFGAPVKRPRRERWATTAARPKGGGLFGEFPVCPPWGLGGGRNNPGGLGLKGGPKTGKRRENRRGPPCVSSFWRRAPGGTIIRGDPTEGGNPPITRVTRPRGQKRFFLPGAEERKEARVRTPTGKLAGSSKGGNSSGGKETQT